MEELSNLNIAITTTTGGGEQDIGRIAYLARTITLFYGIEQSIGSVPELLQLVPSTPAFIYIRNMGTGIVIVDSTSTMNSFPQRIIPGGSLCLSPETNTIYAKSNLPNGKIWVMSVY